MFTNKLQLAAEGWNIISKNSEGRVSARKLLLWLAETLEVSSLGINFYNEQTAYSWSEQVDRGSLSLPVPGSAEIWKHPFPSGESYWLIEGFRGNREDLMIFLNLLARQWLQVNNMENIENHRHRLLKVPQCRVSDNPSWIAVSRFARNIRSKLPELSFSTRPLLLSGENGSGKKYLASLIHINCQNPSDPFTGPLSDEETGTLFIPDWQLICNTDRKRYLEDKRRLIAAIIPGEETASILNLWNKMTGDQRSVIKIPALREHIEDIPMLAGHFLEQRIRNSGLSVPAISSIALEALTAYSWPGNIRELKETIAWSVEKFSDSQIKIGDLPPAVRGAVNLPGKHSYPERIAALEYKVIKEELLRQHGNVSRTARILGLSPRQVSWRTKKYGIDPREIKSHHQF